MEEEERVIDMSEERKVDPKKWIQIRAIHIRIALNASMVSTNITDVGWA